MCFPSKRGCSPGQWISKIEREVLLRLFHLPLFTKSVKFRQEYQRFDAWYMPVFDTWLYWLSVVILTTFGTWNILLVHDIWDANADPVLEWCHYVDDNCFAIDLGIHSLLYVWYHQHLRLYNIKWSIRWIKLERIWKKVIWPTNSINWAFAWRYRKT